MAMVKTPDGEPQAMHFHYLEGDKRYSFIKITENILGNL